MRQPVAPSTSALRSRKRRRPANRARHSRRRRFARSPWRCPPHPPNRHVSCEYPLAYREDAVSPSRHGSRHMGRRRSTPRSCHGSCPPPQPSRRICGKYDARMPTRLGRDRARVHESGGGPETLPSSRGIRACTERRRAHCDLRADVSGSDVRSYGRYGQGRRDDPCSLVRRCKPIARRLRGSALERRI